MFGTEGFQALQLVDRRIQTTGIRDLRGAAYIADSIAGEIGEVLVVRGRTLAAELYFSATLGRCGRRRSRRDNRLNRHGSGGEPTGRDETASVHCFPPNVIVVKRYVGKRVVLQCASG